MKIKLMADYECFPLWNCDETLIGNINPAELPISSSTQEKLMQWSDIYDATLNTEDPLQSGFTNEKERWNFERMGFDLWIMLIKELPKDYTVLYFSNILVAVFDKPNQLPLSYYNNYLNSFHQIEQSISFITY